LTANFDVRAVGRRAAAEHAVTFVEPGARIALGTGSTVEAAVPLLAKIPGLSATPTSDVIESVAAAAGIRLTPVANHYHFYLDGADQVTPYGDVVKGSWGAHVREKTLAGLADRRVLMCDQSKLVDEIAGPIPVAVLPYVLALYDNHKVMKTDENGLVIVLVDEGTIPCPLEWDRSMVDRPGVHSTGIFPAHMIDKIIVGCSDGSIEVRTPKSSSGESYSGKSFSGNVS
jgi:ribose 5-phosphate isomerase A